MQTDKVSYVDIEINHRPIFKDIESLVELLSIREDAIVKYVCTTSVTEYDCVAYDIFYRETPNPTYQNRYFGLTRDKGVIYINNADNVESLLFGMIEVGGELHYSQHRHDYNCVGNIAIDGGRAYTRLVGDTSVLPKHTLRIKDGEFIYG